MRWASYFRCFRYFCRYFAYERFVQRLLCTQTFEETTNSREKVAKKMYETLSIYNLLWGTYAYYFFSLCCCIFCVFSWIALLLLLLYCMSTRFVPTFKQCIRWILQHNGLLDCWFCADKLWNFSFYESSDCCLWRNLDIL